MKTFDLFLVSADHAPVDAETILAGLRDVPHLGQDPNDPSRLFYANEHSGVRFFLLVDEQYLPPPEDEDAYAEPFDEEEDEEPSPFQDEDEDEDEDDDEEEDEDHPEVDTPPLTVNIPLFHPRPFAREALEIVASLRERTGLAVIDPQESGVGDGEPGDYGTEELLASWIASHGPVFADISDPSRVERWAEDFSSQFFDYCRARPNLLEEVAGEGLEVPRLFAARHEGRVKSLCVWRSDQPAVLPKCELVLLERVREKRGLLGRRKKVDQVLVSGERLWSILSPFADARSNPVSVLVFRRADDPPAQVLNDLADLEGEPVGNAKRTELAGVVDFDIPTESSSPSESTQEAS